MIALWVVLVASVSFGVYKNFTAIDQHTTHEIETIQLRLNDTNGIENFVKNFAKSYYTWNNSKEAIEARTQAISAYLTQELQDLNVDTVKMCIRDRMKGVSMAFYKDKGKRIRASDKNLVYRFCAGTLLLLFVAVLLLLNMGQLMRCLLYTSLANGSLSSQSGGEGEIRKNIINADLVDCIIAMPTQLFYTTQIPVSLWFLARNKKQQGKTLFIDARKMGKMVTRKLRELEDGDIQKLANTYKMCIRDRSEVPRRRCEDEGEKPCS